MVDLSDAKSGKNVASAGKKKFSPSRPITLVLKTQTLTLQRRAGLERLASSVGKVKEVGLSIFFAANTYKLSIPFRFIVPERNAWKHKLSG